MAPTSVIFQVLFLPKKGGGVVERDDVSSLTVNVMFCATGHENAFLERRDVGGEESVRRGGIIRAL